MTTATLSLHAGSLHSPARRMPLRERISAGGAAVLAILATIGAIGLVVLALLVVPLAAALAFGPSLLALV